MKVITFNIENGGFNQKLNPSDYVRYLRTLNADIICIQESWYRNPDDLDSEKCENTAQDIAILMGMNFHQATYPYGCAILSRFPFIHIFDPKKVCGVIVADGSDGSGGPGASGPPVINVFNVHLNDYPGYFYTIRGFDYYDTPTDKSIEDMIELSWENHKDDIKDIFDCLDRQSVGTFGTSGASGASGTSGASGASGAFGASGASGGPLPTIIAGDFNEPSHFDLMLHKNKVSARRYDWKVSQYLEQKCFVDTFIAKYPGRLEYTNNIVRVYKDHNCPDGLPPSRVDFIYSRGHKEIISTEIKMDTNFSDHQPVISEIIF